jgi:hypothetical protein
MVIVQTFATVTTSWRPHAIGSQAQTTLPCPGGVPGKPSSRLNLGVIRWQAEQRRYRLLYRAKPLKKTNSWGLYHACSVNSVFRSVKFLPQRRPNLRGTTVGLVFEGAADRMLHA